MRTISADVMFIHASAAHARMYYTMEKYLPKDIVLSNYVGGNTIFSKKSDILVSHYGWSTYQPFFNYISPKAVISELVTPAIKSYFREHDIMFVYHEDQYKELINDGINAVLWPRPVDPEIFNYDNSVKDIDILMPSCHDADVAYIVDRVCKKLNKNYIILTNDIRLPGVKDYTFDFNKIRSYFNRAKYVVSIVLPKYYGNNDEYITHGFEVGYIEGMFCGAIPVILDMPTSQYLKYWYSDYAKFIGYETMEKDLFDILSEPYIPMSKALISKAVKRYNAKEIWGQFWGAIRQVVY